MRQWSASLHSISSHCAVSPVLYNTLINCYQRLPAGVKAFSNIATTDLVSVAPQHWKKKVSLPTHNQLITPLQLVFLFFYVLKLHQSFRQGCPFRRGCKLLFSCLIYHSFYPEMSLLLWAGLRPVRHRGTSYGTLLSLWDKRQQLSHEGQQSLISKQFPDLWSHRLLIQCWCVVALLSLPLRLCVSCWYPSCSASLSCSLVLPSVFPSANTICTYDWQRCKYVYIISCICSSNSKTSSKIMLPFEINMSTLGNTFICFNVRVGYED